MSTRAVIDVSNLPHHEFDTYDPVWWGNNFLLAIETSMFAILIATYFYLRQNSNSDLGISGHHARIFRGPEGYVIEDLKSRNGTWLNGTRVFHSILQNGDSEDPSALFERFMGRPPSLDALLARNGL